MTQNKNYQGVPNEEQDTSIGIRNSKLVNKGNYLLVEIIRSHKIPPDTAGY
jgi:hypothetical protein